MNPTKQATAPSKPPARPMLNDVLIAGGGFISTLASMLLGYLVLRWMHVVFITWMAWAIVPMGALVLGAAAAWGFYKVATRLQKRISVFGAVLMGCLLIPAYFGHYYVIYKNFAIAGPDGRFERIEEMMTFPAYYRWEITSRSYSTPGVPRRSSRPIGAMGYVAAGLELLGFLAGGIAVILILLYKPYCNCCQVFHKARLLATTVDQRSVEPVVSMLREHREADLLHVPEQWKDRLIWNEMIRKESGFYLDLHGCPSCRADSVVRLERRVALGRPERTVLAESPVSADTAKSLSLASPLTR